MSGRPGRPGTPRSGSSRHSGGHRSGGASGPRRPGGSGGSNDNVLPLITGVLGSSILAFSLYVFSHNPGLLGEIVHGDDDDPQYPSVSMEACKPTAAGCEPAAAGCEPALEAYQPYGEAYQPYGATHQPHCEACKSAAAANPDNPGPTISIEKKKWLTEQEEETLKERRQKEKQLRGKLRKELSEHLQKVKEIRDELHKDKTPKNPWE